ncbi:MAG: DNA polymerase III subunit delta [gamma proteobacterium symbiont of Bathyaustriella thionipta]|nr:DNA polymerase III subunit delta [gamma proteobacterium symbiont of Bathyaustriella thionipta]MCU7950451.1 DNA polymerase III subunit delta [gamma proteobacterium symbiont of Bathyaustriella thionipta]MCU7952292.1 DNA polymerase III subunit delta [gamma proteobacterium symbiont of Bathyaustriella thionipta]MCU7956967.1 DNA polymerase III subunit delta [gamma proteobacterium symbiont of Bathyaustriella thionipta]MCU7966721.1 DNA polymerase III subunit delta [gamma proteobacterium symbiont of 
MQIKADQLRNDLKARQHPVYMVCGDEPLQHWEAVDMLRKAAHYYGYEEREVYTADAHFDWNLLLAAANELSLFARKKVIEVHMPTGKPSDKGTALIQYCDNLPPDIMLIIVAGKVESATKKSKWYKALDAVAGIVTVWSIEGRQLNQFLQRRLQTKGLALQADSLQLINDRVEGNLLAADQEIEKLSLLYPLTNNKQMVSLDYEQVAEAVFDSARYNLFELFDCALSGDLKRASRMLYGLQREGLSIILIMSLVAKEVRMLAKMSAIVDGQQRNIEAAMKGVYIFPKRKSLLAQALCTSRPEHWQQLLKQLLHADKMAKGAETGDPWDMMQLILAAVAGKTYLSSVKNL